MNIKNIIKILSLVLVFGFSSVSAQTIKWSMQGDSLTLDPHAQNEGPTNKVGYIDLEGILKGWTKIYLMNNAITNAYNIDLNVEKNFEELLLSKLISS